MRLQQLQLILILLSIGSYLPRRAAATENRDAIVVLPIAVDAKPDPDLEYSFVEQLRLGGNKIVGSSSLSSEEQSCRQAACLSLILERLPDAGRLLRVDIATVNTGAKDGAAGARTLKVEVSGFILSSKKSWSRAGFCTPCLSQKMLLTTLAGVANQALAGPPADTQNPELVQTPAGDTSHPKPSRWPRSRIATVAVLGGASLLTLALAAGLSSLHGQPTTFAQCTPMNPTPLPADPNQCLFRTLPELGGTLFAGGAALGVTAIALTVIWPRQAKPKAMTEGPASNALPYEATTKAP